MMNFRFEDGVVIFCVSQRYVRKKVMKIREVLIMLNFEVEDGNQRFELRYKMVRLIERRVGKIVGLCFFN